MINAYDTLQQHTDESTKAYLHRVQDILECIHHPNDMSSISAISINHTKILIGLKDGKLHNKLADSKAKKWTNMVQVLQDIADMAVNFERSRGYLLPSLESTTHCLMLITILVSFTGLASHLQKRHNNTM